MGMSGKAADLRAMRAWDNLKEALDLSRLRK